MSAQILISPQVLSLSYSPEKLLHREKEKTELSNNIENFVNTFVCGPCGSGKTTLVKNTILSLDKEVNVAYVDCSIYRTTYSILKEILPRSEFMLYRSNYELTKELLKYAKQRKFAICFDNFEKLKEKDLIARLISLNVCVVLISDEEESFSLLSDNVRSNIPDVMRLQLYTTEQTFDILKDRAEITLAKWSCPDEVIRKIAEKIKGNVTIGINVLKLAALKAERDGKDSLDAEDIQVNNDCAPKLSRDEKALLKILQEWKSLPAGRLYDFYEQSVRHPKGERSFRNYMESLCEKGLVRSVGEKRGRVYEVVGVDENVAGKN